MKYGIRPSRPGASAWIARRVLPRLRTVVMCTAIALLSGVHCRPSAAADTMKLIQTGIDALRQNDYTRAVDLFLEAQLADPNEPLAPLGLGLAATGAGDTAGAIVAYNDALQLDPTNATAHLNMGLLLLRRGATTEALNQFQEAVQSPRATMAKICRAYALILLNSPQMAFSEVAPMLVQAPNDPLLLQVTALACLDSGDSDKAIAALRRELEVMPATSDSTSAWPRLIAPGSGKVSGLTVVLADGGSAKRGFVDQRRALLLKAPGQNIVHPAVTVSSGGDTSFSLPKPAAPGTVSGVAVVTASADGLNGASYAMFLLNGEVKAVTNSRPFKWTWNTRESSNGQHVIVIRGYGPQAEQVGEERQVVTVYNAPVVTPAPRDVTPRRSSADYNRLAAQLDDMVHLDPSRTEARYLLARAYEARGLFGFAHKEFRALFCDDPTLPDVRDQLLACRAEIGRSHPSVPPAEVWRVLGTGKRVALTFDDGPRPYFTEEILKLLREYDARATFFVVGKMAAAYPDLVREIKGAGHELASHSYTHPNLAHKTALEVEQELLKTEKVVSEIADVELHLFRPPGGDYNQTVRDVLSRLGYTGVFWTTNITSYPRLDPPEIAERLFRTCGDGGVVLMHNGKDKTLPTLPYLLRLFHDAGYQFVTVSELIKSGTGIVDSYRDLKTVPVYSDN